MLSFQSIGLGSLSGAGTQPDVFGSDLAISADGRKLAFSSFTDLVAGDTNGIVDIFVKDLVTGQIVRANTTSGGVQSNVVATIGGPVFSPDGSKLMFVSDAPDLVAGDTNGKADLFVKDLTTGAIERVNTFADGSEDPLGLTLLSPIAPGRFSADGTKVVFTAKTALLGSDTNNKLDVYIKTLADGSLVRGSTLQNGSDPNDDSQIGALSGDGTKLVFASAASNLVAGDTNGATDIFVKDLAAGDVVRVNTTAAGAQTGDLG